MMLSNNFYAGALAFVLGFIMTSMLMGLHP